MRGGVESKIYFVVDVISFFRLAGRNPFVIFWWLVLGQDLVRALRGYLAVRRGARAMTHDHHLYERVSHGRRRRQQQDERLRLQQRGRGRGQQIVNPPVASKPA